MKHVRIAVSKLKLIAKLRIGLMIAPHPNRMITFGVTNFQIPSEWSELKYSSLVYILTKEGFWTLRDRRDYPE